jgi:hypothetical protein
MVAPCTKVDIVLRLVNRTTFGESWPDAPNPPLVGLGKLKLVGLGKLKSLLAAESTEAVEPAVIVRHPPASRSVGHDPPQLG